MKELRVVMTETRFREPLAMVDLPGEGAELRPAQMRALAAALVRAADECEARPLNGKHASRMTRSYPITAVTPRDIP